GTLKGLESKLGYLARLGVTALWISPVFKQPSWDNYAYHGYAIQNFLDVDPHFGTRQDLRDMVDTAHRLGIRVILDVILNHAGDVFGYRADRYPEFNGQSYEVEGFRDEFGHANQRFGPVDVERHPRAWPNRAVWPAELQEPGTFSRKGRINNWDRDPEYLEGDFHGLKDIDHGWHERDMAGIRKLDAFHPSAALAVLCEVYKFWIAFADIDGFRIDTVKHMEIGATRHFALAIHEFAQSLGKENFLLVGEITGGRTRAFETMELTGLDAALGVDEIGRKLDEVPKGKCDPAEYFALFRNSAVMGRESHAWFGRHVVTMLDDHDQVWKNGHKARFCADPGNEGNFRFLLPAIALNLLTLGIPCLYYGTEQGFDGWGDNDRFLRECMFGGQFGSLQSAGHHFFNEDHPTYREIARLAAVRHQHLALRRGRQYLREVSISGTEGDFAAPRLVSGQLRGIVAWSRLFAGSEVLCAINTDPDNTAIA
ncbi:MAG: hypothetical protein K2Q10_08165, partial [Rhodospirillales bacterium]|nr:hypothetical protein [Rhodospirillales bacterium]